MELTLAPGIVVLNRKYFPATERSASPVGSTSFALSVLKALYEVDVLSGIVLYCRDENLVRARYDVGDEWNGIPIVTVHFHFRMSHNSIASILKDAFIWSLQKENQPMAPIIYYQTDTLIAYHPQGLKFCVTHHGPLVAHFVGQFSIEAARLAFGGEPDKVETLLHQQSRGIRRLLLDHEGTVLVHSKLQRRILENYGVESGRFRSLRPPIGVPKSLKHPILSRQLQDFIQGSQCLVFTAVARLDYFKNVDLLVESCLLLLSRGKSTRLLVIGDPEEDSSHRQALLASVPADKRDNFLILPSFAKDHLYALFTIIRSKGIFICTSRYETLGITPLEAAACGVTTFIADRPNIEALSFLPPKFHIDPDPESIASSVERTYNEGLQGHSETVKEYVRSRTSLEGFCGDLLHAWVDMSRNYTLDQPAFTKCK
ncbi:hypothetical protein F66182_1317 [Fusarium sp. NRRL 66182]|nr:hypothetical protein F66182_1317 [Fusarium sp. NRRL 66182]